MHGLHLGGADFLLKVRPSIAAKSFLCFSANPSALLACGAVPAFAAVIERYTEKLKAFNTAVN